LTFANETFKIKQQELPSFRLIKNPRNRIKRIGNTSPSNNLDKGAINSRNFARDHRDTIIYKKIPKGYKLIGIRALKNTHGDNVLHFVDFVIWKVPKGWPQFGLASSETKVK
jgi:hypothetical protein